MPRTPDWIYGALAALVMWATTGCYGQLESRDYDGGDMSQVQPPDDPTERPDDLPPKTRDEDGDGWLTPHDCDDTDPAIAPNVTELCDGIDNDCDDEIDEGCQSPDLGRPPEDLRDMRPSPTPDPDLGPDLTEDMGPPPAVDVDRDGHPPPEDCDDLDETVYPGATEVCGDGVDNNCVGGIDEGCQDPQPDGELGATCTQDTDCSGTCLTGWPGGFCSQRCASMSCPGGSTCYDLPTSQGGAVALCLSDCTSRSQCRDNQYACYPTSIGGACLPACRGDHDCNSGYVCDMTSGQCVTDPGTPTNPGAGVASQQPATGQVSDLQISTASGTRSYRLYVPSSYSPATPMPVLLVYHGNGDTAVNFYQFLQLGQWAEGSGFIAAALYGPPRNIMGYQLAWDAFTSAGSNPDLEFTEAVLADLRAQYTVDDDRIWALGHSQGGFFTLYAGLVRANTFAAIAIQAAAAPQGGALIQGAARPTPVWLAIGTQDGLLGAARSTRQQLEQAGHPVEYIEMPGVGHGGWQGNQTQSALDFLLGHSL